MAADNRPLDQIFDPRFTKDMTIRERMHLAMTRMDYVQKDRGNAGQQGALKYSIVSHDKVTALVRENTVACGIIYYPLLEGARFTVNGNRAELVMAVRFESIHDSDDGIEVLGIGFGIDTGDKGPGKAISYATKYALLKAFGLETGDDPDLDQNVQHRSSTSQRADDLEKLLATADEATMRAELTNPSTDAIFQALQRDEPAEYRRMRQVVAQQAKRVGLDLRTLKGDPA